MAWFLSYICCKLINVSANHNMKRLLLGLTATVLFASCIQKEYYNVEPDPTPVGYQTVFNDDFVDNRNNWVFDDVNNDAYVDIYDGRLEYYYYPVNAGTNTVAVQTGARLNNNFLVQTRIRSNYAMGLAFGVSNTNYGYSFFIDNQGYFAVYKEGSANVPVETIVDWTQSSAIRQGNAWNDVEIEQVGGYWVGYINGVQVFDIPAQYLGGTKFGFIVLDGTQGYAEYLTVQW